MSNFEERMEARKLKEAHEQAEKQKEMGIQKYRTVFSMNILGTSAENAQETFHILSKILGQFEDLSDVSGEMHDD